MENAFKHGVERLIENAIIHIDLTAKENLISFEIENNFDPKEKNENSGIGLTNLIRRLALIYPKKHKLLLEETESNYKAILEIDCKWQRTLL